MSVVGRRTQPINEMGLFSVFLFLIVVKFSCGWHNRCERITVPLCQNLGYNLTTLPNFMDHKDQAQAERAVSCLRKGSNAVQCNDITSHNYSMCIEIAHN